MKDNEKRGGIAVMLTMGKKQPPPFLGGGKTAVAEEEEDEGGGIVDKVAKETGAEPEVVRQVIQSYLNCLMEDAG